MISILVILAIVLSIVLGYKTKINTGFFAMVGAYFIGCFLMGMKGTEVIATWPIKIFFVIFAVSVFYNFAILNGTLEKLSQQMLYLVRKSPKMLPFLIFFAALLVAALGAGYFTVLAFFGPITLILCEKSKLSKLSGMIAVNSGALAGSNFITSASGIIFKNLIEASKIEGNVYFYTGTIFIVTTIIPLILIGILVFSNRSKNKEVAHLDVEKPTAFNKEQKLTLNLIFLMVFIVLLFPILKLIVPSSHAISFINSKMDIGLIAILFTVIAFMFKLGNQKKIIATVPWNTIIMICGVGMLISIAIKAGTIEILSNWIGSNIPVFLVPVILCVVAGIMSFFSSTLGVVTPALFPMVSILSAKTGLNPAILYSAIVAGAQATSISPFSSGGSLLIGAVKEEEKDKIFGQMMFKGAPLSLVFTTIILTIVAMLLLK